MHQPASQTTTNQPVHDQKSTSSPAIPQLQLHRGQRPSPISSAESHYCSLIRTLNIIQSWWWSVGSERCGWWDRSVCPSRSQYTTAIHPSADAPISDALLQFDSMMRTRRTCGDYYAITMIISEGQSGLNTSSIRWLNRWIDNYIMIRLYSPYIPGAKWNGNIDQGWMVPRRSLDDTNNNVINAADIFACSIVERNWLNI